LQEKLVMVCSPCQKIFRFRSVDFVEAFRAREKVFHLNLAHFHPKT